jgi:hypothetical protein
MYDMNFLTTPLTGVKELSQWTFLYGQNKHGKQAENEIKTFLSPTSHTQVLEVEQTVNSAYSKKVILLTSCNVSVYFLSNRRYLTA